MKHLTVRRIHGHNRLDGSGEFEPLDHLHNRHRNVAVYDPTDPYGPPVYEGRALEVGKYLDPGVYPFEWADEVDDW